MNYKDILRNKPWLKIYNAGKVNSRLLKATNRNAFIVYNAIQGNFELHTVEAEQLSGDSYNATIPQEVLNQWIIEDYNSNDFNKYVDDIISEKQKTERFAEIMHSDDRRKREIEQQLLAVERVMGTKL